MTFPILGGNSAVAGYSIDNSLRFNDDDSAKLALSSFSPLYTFSSGTWSVWLKRSNLGTDQYFFSSHVQGGGDNKGVMLRWTDDNKIRILVEDGSNYLTFDTSALFRDTSAWYHIYASYSGSNIMDESNWTLKVNGVTQSGTASKSGSQSTITLEGFSIGARFANSAFYLDGYVAEYHFIDGSVVDVSNFAEADQDSGIWKPIKYTGSYGSKGFYLDFSNSSTLGEDFSGNDNDFTATNLASTDQTTDTPTNNFATLNSLQTTTSSSSLQEGNTNFTVTANGAGLFRNTLATVPFPSSGKWYMETKVTHTNLTSDSGNQVYVGVVQNQANINALSTSNVNSISNNGFFSDVSIVGTLSDRIQSGTNGSATTYNTNPDWSSGDIVGIAIDMDNGKIYYHLNGTYYNDSGGTTANPSAGTNPNATFTAGMELTYFQSILRYNTSNVEINANFGNPSYSISSGNSDGNGYGNFEYSVPSGYLALCTQNLATALSPTIDDGSAYFQTATYTGNGGTQSIVNDGNSDLQPDWIWTKQRSGTEGHSITDSSRGNTKYIFSNSTGAELTDTDRVTAFNSDGFSIGADIRHNTSSATYVAWQWKANGGTTSSNTDGSITSTVQANTTAGFSIVTYTGNATAGATIGHGLGVKPDMIIAKNRSTTKDWLILHKAYEGTSAENMRFRTDAVASAGSQDSSGWYRTAPTSSVFYVGNGSAGDYSGDTNTSGSNMVAYCFADIEGYSKFGSYTGNGSSDGTFVYTGFRPAFVIIKVTSTTENWVIRDNKRDTYNNVYHQLLANASSAEDTTNDGRFSQDFLSNGFKIRATHATTNQSGASYIYMAFAENPFVSSSGIPVTAR